MIRGLAVWAQRLGEFVTLFLVINPIAVVPVYLALVGHIKRPQAQRRIALNAVVIAFIVLAFFLFAGGFPP
jgi:multiple antibiotic resistance protein